MEATSNAFWIHDILSDYPGQVVVANPLKTRAIAEARVKTDALDAQILAQLLAADFIPESWVPSKEEYQLRILLNHRIRLAKIRTMLKNKIHAALIRNGIQSPWSDLFGVNGRKYLEKVSLPETEQIVVCSSLKLLDFVQQEMNSLEGDLFARARTNPNVPLLMGIPGISVLRRNSRPSVSRSCKTLYRPWSWILSENHCSRFTGDAYRTPSTTISASPSSNRAMA